MADTLFYVAQKAFIKKGDKILVLLKDGKRVDFPGGKISDEDSNFAESLTREVTEETGLNITVGEPFKTWSFTLPASHKNAGTKVFVVGHECAYLSGDVTISKEHTTSVWVDRHVFTTLDDGSIWFEVLKFYFGRG